MKGTVELGKYADFVVLSEDLRRIDPDRIADVQMLMTFLGGTVVYESPQALEL